jgi:hypothetical protein
VIQMEKESMKLVQAIDDRKAAALVDGGAPQ